MGRLKNMFFNRPLDRNFEKRFSGATGARSALAGIAMMRSRVDRAAPDGQVG